MSALALRYRFRLSTPLRWFFVVAFLLRFYVMPRVGGLADSRRQSEAEGQIWEILRG
jgi:hypothetical protein